MFGSWENNKKNSKKKKNRQEQHHSIENFSQVLVLLKNVIEKLEKEKRTEVLELRKQYLKQRSQ